MTNQTLPPLLGPRSPFRTTIPVIPHQQLGKPSLQTGSSYALLMERSMDTSFWRTNLYMYWKP